MGTCLRAFRSLTIPLRLTLTVAVLLTGLVLLDAEEATASTCNVVAYTPVKSNGGINGKGVASCTTRQIQRLTVKVEQYRGAGIWRAKATKSTSNIDTKQIVRTARWYCAGTKSGTQKYRTVAEQRVVTGGNIQYRKDTSATATITCN